MNLKLKSILYHCIALCPFDCAFHSWEDVTRTEYKVDPFDVDGKLKDISPIRDPVLRAKLRKEYVDSK